MASQDPIAGTLPYSEKNKKLDVDEKMEITEKADIAEGQISALDASEIFLQESRLTHEYIHELLGDEQRRKNLVKKIDLLLMPLMMGTFTLQYIDKQSMSYGAVFDLLSGTHTTGTQYAWLATIFYLGYLVAEYPWSFLAQKWSVSKVVSVCVTVWGAVLMITAACSSFPGLAACRFLLGIFEAPITPCFMMIVGTWYTREEQPFRAGAFYCCNGVGSMVGGILTYGIGQEDAFPVWRITFILCGGMTVVWGAVLMFFLPEDPMSSKRFSTEQKAMLIARGQQNQTGILNKEIKYYQICEALLDPQVWILFIFTLLNEVINGGIANFSKLILKGVVHGDLQTTALTIPQGAFQVFFILSGTYFATRFRNLRTTMMIVYIMPTIIGIALLWKLPRTNKYGLLMGFYICGSFVASLVLALQMPAANLAGYTKRVTATAFVFLAYCLGNIIGPHAFLASEAPIYQTGCKVVVGCAVGQIFLTVLLRILLLRRNKQRDAMAPAPADGNEDVISDMTDFENPHFRYVL